MKLVSLICNQCGAALEIPEETRFFTCQFCKTNLSVEQSGNAIFTKVLEELDRKTDRLVEDVETLKRGSAIDRLDREWELHQQDLMVTNKDGHKHIPTKATSVIGGVFIVVFGIIWTTIAFGITADSPFGFAVCFPVFGVVFVIFGVIQVAIAFNKAGDYDKAYRNYKRKRAELLASQENE